ncbi:MAG: peptide chain release factor N(5)-glutamine methyltransferase [Gracilimonas sp.]|uniref:peptide chain release factor N(5)-glutamine methyltransferase n=1 Tax=Gracilimonas sp. TaxID=1974203 RepID=UPI00198B895B|nr:peptide chain release factor N(5)-glutamine methyltransferase [Gracilimonas sp.]MBD3616829.1 peptide chain release factor N(5)-glutamine methyltransferase [Gracilimonas sp.]
MTKVPSIWTVLSMMEWATDFFEDKGVKSPRLSIEWLLAHVLSIKRLDLYLEYDRPLSSDELALLKPMVKRRAAHEPLQYITGETDFHHVKIKVEPGVLIPRQETEQLVDWILELYDESSQLTVLDVGTGSGCIPVALKNARPGWDLFATDISEEALAIAEENARYNEVTIELAQDDLFEPKAFPKNKFDLIVSNPPYIHYEEKNTLDDEVKNYEPELALFCESTHKMFQALENLCYNYLIQNGEAFFELHEDHAEEARQVFQGDKWTTIIKTDYSQKPRFLKAKKD